MDWTHSADKLTKHSTQTPSTGESAKIITTTDVIELNDRVAMKKILGGEYMEAQNILLEVLEVVKHTTYDCVKMEYLHHAICHYNLACIYQKTWKNQECCIHIERSIEYQELQIAQCTHDLDKLSRKIELIRCYLQYCAVLSQLGRHDRSLEMSKCIIRSEKDIFTQCKRFCEEHLQAYENNKYSNTNMVQFQTVLISEAYQKLKYLAEIPEADVVLSDYRDLYQTVSESIYYWKNIPENNERFIRKELHLEKNSKSVRNVLGVCKNEQWIDSFNIGSVMMMKPKMIEQRIRSDLLHIISAKCLLQQIFYTSIGYFTIATEIRFKEVENEVKGLKQNEKMMRMSQNNFVKMCKIYHLKAIQLAGRYVATSSQYINHLIVSFNKNYKSTMDSIVQYILTQNQQSVSYNDSIICLEKPIPEYIKTIVNSPLAPAIQTDCGIFSRKAPFHKNYHDVQQTHIKNVKQCDFEKHNHLRSNIRRVRANTRDHTQRVVSPGLHKRPNRVRSEQAYKKCQQIKTFTFKFVKQVKQSELLKKKKTKKKKRSVSKNRKKK